MRRQSENSVAVRISLLEKFSGKFRRCWTILHRFSGSTKCYPCQGLRIFRQGKLLLENWPSLRERSWIFSSETATAFLSFSELIWTVGSRLRHQTRSSLVLLKRRSSLVLLKRSWNCGSLRDWLQGSGAQGRSWDLIWQLRLRMLLSIACVCLLKIYRRYHPGTLLDALATV